MPDIDGARVTARLLTKGYAQACSRFRLATAGEDPGPSFFALFEALNWAHALDDFIALNWRPSSAIETEWWWGWRGDPSLGRSEELRNVLDGLRYVRNRVHHQWADALVVGDTRAEIVLNELLDPHLGPGHTVVQVPAWRWRAAAELPAPTRGRLDRRGLNAYTAALAGRKAEDTLTKISQPFAVVSGLLDAAAGNP